MSVKNLTTYLHTRGYFSPKVEVQVDTTRRYRRAEITYTIHQGEPMRIDSLELEILDESVKSLILADTANIAPG